jgi:hypothetical protein
LIVVLDTNIFHGDVHARLMRLSLVLDGAAHGDFEIVIPEVVVKELVHQFPTRVKAAVEEAHRSLGRIQREFRPLGLQGPAEVNVDIEGLVKSYEESLRQRFSGRHCRVAPTPDLSSSIEWAVAGRKPFKDSGVGIQDAAIWLTVVGLAAKGQDTVVLVTQNTADFADPGQTTRLAPEMLSDLRASGIPEDRVRFVHSLDDLIQDLITPLSSADRRAERIMADPLLVGRLRSAVASAIRERRVDPYDLDYDVDLLDWPRIVAGTLDQPVVFSIGAAEGDRLWMMIRAYGDVRLSATVQRELADDVADMLSAEIGEGSIGDETISIEWATAIRVECAVTTDTDIDEPEVSIYALDLLTPPERLQRNLDSNGIGDLGLLLADSGHYPKPVRDYTPRASHGSPLDLAELVSFSLTEAVLDQMQDSDDVALLRAYGTGSVHWISTSPTPEAIAEFAPDAEAPTAVLDEIADDEPIEMSFRATPDPDGGWFDVEIVNVEYSPGDRA